MVKEQKIEMQGVVTELLKNAMFRYVSNGIEILAYSSGSIRRNRIRILQNDKVRVVLSTYDTSKGIITIEVCKIFGTLV